LSNGKSVGTQTNPGSPAIMNATPLSFNAAIAADHVCAKTISVALPAGVAGTATSADEIAYPTAQVEASLPKWE
jgi:hypothetical protein